MTKILEITIPRAVKISKKWDSRSNYGQIIYGHRGYGAADECTGIYQQRKCKEGKITIREKLYVPADTWSQAKEDAQKKLAAAVLAYQNLTAEEKLIYHERAIGNKFSGYNLFVKEYLLA